jgi:hypothetical protein
MTMYPTTNGLVKLRQPAGQSFTHISLGSSGKTVSPDPKDGTIVVSAGDASPLLAAGWTIVQPLPPRRAA